MAEGIISLTYDADTAIQELALCVSECFCQACDDCGGTGCQVGD